MKKIIYLLSSLVALSFVACETARSGGPAATHRAQKGDVSYDVAPSGGQSQAFYYEKAKLDLDSNSNVSRRVVFRGKHVQSIPQDMRDAVIALEKLYCETMMERKYVLSLLDVAGNEARAQFLEKTAKKVRAESHERFTNIANGNQPSAYVSDKAKPKVNAKAEMLKARADEAIDQQSKVVALMGKYEVGVYRVFATNDGLKELRLPQ